MRAGSALAAAAVVMVGMALAQAQAQTPAAAPAPPPAFDCAKAYLPVDYVICSSPDLLKINDELSVVWRALRERLGEAERQTALEAQRQWIKDYSQTCGLTGKGKPPADRMAAAVPCVAKELRGRGAKLRMQLAELPPAVATPTKPAPVAAAPGGARWQGEANPVAADGKAARLSILDKQAKSYQATFTVRDSGGASWTLHTTAQAGSAAAVFPEDFLTPRQAGRYSYEVLVDLQPALKGTFQLP